VLGDPSIPPAIETRGLSRRFGASWALVSLELQVPRGAALLVAGRNGSGKSTLLRVVAGALRPSTGTIRVDGHEDPLERRRRTGLLAHASFTYEPLSALQNLQVVARILERPAQPRALMPVLERVGLAPRAHDEVHRFSAGMRKRLALARLLLQEPAIALLDEPYAQLDPQGFRLVDAIFAELRARGATVVLASHLLDRGAALCEQAVLLERGRLAWQGPSGQQALSRV
jgi:heme exporter protein A